MIMLKNKRWLWQGMGFALTVWLLGALLPGAAEELRHYVMATATPGGTYYPVGIALATLVKSKLRSTLKIDMAAVTSAGSTENIRLLEKNQAQFAILSALVGYYAGTGKGPFAATGPQTDLRSVTGLWRDVEHFVIKKQYAKTGTIIDMQALRGEKVSLGLKDSGTIELNRLLLGNLGIDITEMELVYLGYDASAMALQRGRIAAMSTSAGVPVSAVTRAMTAPVDELVILAFTDAQLAAADAGLGLWSRYVIAAGTYPNQNEDVATAATPAFVAVRADVEEAVVYQITKAIYQDLPFLQHIHKALLDTDLDNALTSLPVPLHPGALRFYREVGLIIPDKLMAE